MPATSKTSIGSDKNAPMSKKKKEKAHPAVEYPDDPVGSSEEDDSDDGGVDSEGMARLMKALGDDGLDEFEQVQLHLALGGDEDLESGSDVDVEAEAGEGEAGESDGSEDDEHEEEVDGDEQQEEEEVALDDVDSVDEDAVPRQKIEIDNKVCHFFCYPNWLFYLFHPRCLDCFGANSRRHPTRPVHFVDRNSNVILSTTNRGRRQRRP